MPLRLPWFRRSTHLSDEEFAEFIAPPLPHGQRSRRGQRRPRGGVPRLNGPVAIVIYLAGGLLVGIGVLGIAASMGGVPADQPIDAVGRLWGEIIDLLTGR